MKDSEIQRINELAKKSKLGELSTQEKEEQTLLRKKFIKEIRNNLRADLNNISIVNEDGSITNLGEKHKNDK